MLAVSYCLTAGLSLLLYPLEFGPRVPVNIEDFYRDLQAINFTILAAQATFVGLVFPIVIALVGLLSEGKISYRGRLNLFLEESEATFVGTSALVLIATLLVQALVLSQLPERVGAALTGLNIFWFACNVYAIGFFLFQTLRYVQPDLRFEIEKRYIANVVWRDQLTNIIRRNRWGNAQHYGYWPKPENIVGDRDEAPLIITQRFHDKSDHSLSIYRGRSAQLRDVQIFLLGNVLTSWLTRYRDHSERSRFSWFEFSVSPREIIKGRTQILQIKSAPALTKIESILAAWAFKTGRVRPLRDRGTVVQFIEEMISDLIRLAEEGRPSEFHTLLSQLISLHAFLFDIAEAPREDERFNYALMTDGVMGRDLSTEWASAYRDLHKKVVERLGSNPEFFESTAWWSPNIIGLAKKSAFDAVSSAALLSSSHLLRRLLDWAKNSYRATSDSETNASTSFEVPPQLRSEYGKAWMAYVASWERILDTLNPNIDRAGSAEQIWKEIQKVRQAYADHLIRSVEHVALSAASGDEMAVRWSTDLLIKWPSGVLFRDLQHDLFHRARSVSITIDILRVDWQQVIERVEPEYPRTPPPEGWAPDPTDIWTSALENYWSDACAVLTAVLARWMIFYGAQGEGAEAARRIIYQRPHDAGWRGTRDGPDISFSTLLLAPLRIAASQNEEGDIYSGRLSELAGRLLDIGSPQYVSMRIYSGTGTGDYLSLTREQVIILASQVTINDSPVRIDRDVRALFDSMQSDAQRRNIIAHLNNLTAAIEDLNLGEVEPVLRALRSDDEAAARAFSTLKSHLEAHIRAFEEIRDRHFVEADIDPARMRQISEAASNTGFDKETGEFPISLFANVDFVDEPLTDFTLTVSNQNTGEYTQPLFSEPVSNEREFWANTMKQRSAFVVNRDLLQILEAKEIATPTPQAFWNAIQAGASAIREDGQSPILVVASQSEPPWLFDWTRRYDSEIWKPKKLRIARAENQPKGYLYHLNDIPVFVAPMPRGHAYLLSKEAYQGVEFTRYNGLPIQTQFEPEAANRQKGTLKLKFSRRITLGPYTAYRLVLRNPNEAETIEDGGDE